jgi:antitoxin component HigA of HigAB toxin-antitoxin module
MASELLRAKRRVSLTVAQKISAAWGIPIQLLVAPCPLAA